jgi:5-formyltetrahydrofolate cyclo-ligase
MIQFFYRILPACKTIHVFLPLVDKNEPDTLPFIFSINREFPEKRIVVPVITANGGLIHVEPDTPLTLHSGRWNIPVPEYSREVNLENIDCVLLPMLIFDKDGQRIGFGNGYYDSFLPMCRKDCIKLGISLFEPIQKIADPMEADVLMNACVTPDNFYVFDKSSIINKDFINLNK